MGDRICGPNGLVSTVFLSGANLELEITFKGKKYKFIVIPISEDGAIKNILEIMMPQS